MTIIGTLTLKGDRYEGRVQTLTFQGQVTIVPQEKENAKAPDYRVFSGSVELGGAWNRESEQAKAYKSVKLNDPSFPAAVYARLVETPEEGVFNLVWSRSK
jgi:uncharacterized protein (DUF736 family)